MYINSIFIIFYIIFFNSLSGVELFYISIVQHALYIISSFHQKKSVNPIVLFSLGVIIVNIANISTVYQYYDGTITTYSYIYSKYITDAANIWCISSSLIIIGFLLAANKSLPKISFDIKPKKLKIIFQILLAVNLLSIVGHGINFQGALKAFALFNSIGIIFFARLWAKENNNTYKIYTIIIYILQTYAAITTSFLRLDLIFPTVCLCIGYFIGKGDPRYIFSYRIVPFLTIGLIYASVFSSLQGNRSNFINAFTFNEDDNAQQNNNRNSNLDNNNNKQSALLIRSSNVAQITNVVNLVNKNGFYNGTASAPLVIALIPRAFWPEKPKIVLGKWFALEIGQAYKDENGNVNNSINMTFAGELYLDFGWIGIVFGNLLLGAFIALLWNSTEFYLSIYNLTGTILGGYLFIILFLGIGADLQIAITLMSIYLVFLGIKKIIQQFI